MTYSDQAVEKDNSSSVITHAGSVIRFVSSFVLTQTGILLPSSTSPSPRLARPTGQDVGIMFSSLSSFYFSFSAILHPFDAVEFQSLYRNSETADFRRPDPPLPNTADAYEPDNILARISADIGNASQSVGSHKARAQAAIDDVISRMAT